MHKGTFAGSGGVEVKGAGVNVLVLDDGVDIRNEDLIDNVDVTMVRNFDFARDNTASSEFGKFRDSDANAMLAKDDPTPVTTKNGATVNVEASHGTNVAGIINASQNGKGTMGIAPLAKLGGAGFIGLTFATAEEAYGGGSWANRADIINASFGGNPATPPSYAGDGSDSVALRAMVPSATNDAPQTAVNPGLRGGKGGLFIKATGNEFGGIGGRECDAAGSKPFANKVGCETSANDTETLEPMVVNVAAINAAGVKSSYSNASSLNWVSGGGGEFGGNGTYGEGKGDDGTDGPVMFSTDLRSLTRGYSRSNAGTDFLKGLTKSASNVSENANGDYSYMNGTSAATPSVAGVVALIMSANPSLGWRDVREILATTSRKMDGTYPPRVGSGKLFDLVNRQFTADDATAANSLVNWPCLVRVLELVWLRARRRAEGGGGGQGLRHDQQLAAAFDADPGGQRRCRLREDQRCQRRGHRQLPGLQLRQGHQARRVHLNGRVDRAGAAAHHRRHGSQHSVLRW